MALAFISGCCGAKESSAGPSLNDSLPACVRARLNEMEKNKLSLPVKIDEYEWKGKTTYLFTADCCDQYNSLYDDGCKLICAPSGGISGAGDRKCPEFKNEARHLRVLWTKPK
jgi:hypothetical protein